MALVRMVKKRLRLFGELTTKKLLNAARMPASDPRLHCPLLHTNQRLRTVRANSCTISRDLGGAMLPGGVVM